MAMTTAWSEPFERFFCLVRAGEGQSAQRPECDVAGDGRPGRQAVGAHRVDERLRFEGVRFYTNQTSRKGHELIGQRVAALMFYWPSLEEQVRVEGSITQVDAAESDAYFASRARDSQLGAWASHQSEAMNSRAELEARLDAVTKKYAGQAVPRPPHWGGFRLAPERIEFWRAHPNRLHWREQYLKSGEQWVTSILNP